MVSCPGVNFRRVVRLAGLAVGKKVLLIVYWDSSDVAKGVTVYCRCLREDGESKVHMPTSKAKINKLGTMNKPSCSGCLITSNSGGGPV